MIINWSQYLNIWGWFRSKVLVYVCWSNALIYYILLWDIFTGLYVVIRRWRNTSIVALAMFIPRQVLPPIPNAKKLYGFVSPYINGRGKITIILLSFLENKNKQLRFPGRDKTYSKSCWIELAWILVHHSIQVYWFSININVPPSFDLKSYRSN